MKTALVYLTVLVISIGPVAAHGFSSAKPDEREVRRERWIEDGIRSGAITPQEAQRLEKREPKPDPGKTISKDDGKTTPNAKTGVTREEDRSSREYYPHKRYRHHGY